MKISCKYCGIVVRPHKCPHAKRKVDRSRIDSKTYVDRTYRKARQSILEDYDYVCLWSLYINKRYIDANITHHIIEILEDESKADDKENLAPVEYYSHVDIHNLYDSSEHNRLVVQRLLRDMKQSYENGDKMPGKYRERLKKETRPPYPKNFLKIY